MEDKDKAALRSRPARRTGRKGPERRPGKIYAQERRAWHEEAAEGGAKWRRKGRLAARRLAQKEDGRSKPGGHSGFELPPNGGVGRGRRQRVGEAPRGAVRNRSTGRCLAQKRAREYSTEGE